MRIADQQTSVERSAALAALDDGNPVLVLEHKRLYRTARGPVPPGHHVEPIGRARVARPGRDATVVTYGAGVGWALAAADELAAGGVSRRISWTGACAA